MLKYCIAALCFMAVADAGVFPAAKVSRRVNNPFGVVEGIGNCGSAGTILQVRVTDCTVVPCVLVSGGVYVFEIDFIPSVSHSGLNLKVLLLNEGDSHHIIDGSIPDSEVEAGGSYTFVYPITAAGFIQGRSDIRIEISGQVLGTLELCGLAAVAVIPA